MAPLVHCTFTCTCIDTDTITSTFTLLFSCSAHRGVVVSLVDGTKPEEVAAAVDHTTKLVWLEVICDKSILLPHSSSSRCAPTPGCSCSTSRRWWRP